MIETEDGYRLECSGREFYAYGGILGLARDPDTGLSHGYDGYVSEDCIGYERTFTRAERQEIAEAMITRWRQWAQRGSDNA